MASACTTIFQHICFLHSALIKTFKGHHRMRLKIMHPAIYHANSLPECLIELNWACKTCYLYAYRLCIFRPAIFRCYRSSLFESSSSAFTQLLAISAFGSSPSKAKTNMALTSEMRDFVFSPKLISPIRLFANMRPWLLFTREDAWVFSSFQLEPLI